MNKASLMDDLDKLRREYADLREDANRWREELSQAKLRLEREPAPAFVREELETLIGTRDIAEGVAVVRGLKEKAELAEIIERMPEGTQMIFNRLSSDNGLPWLVWISWTGIRLPGSGYSSTPLKAAQDAMKEVLP